AMAIQRGLARAGRPARSRLGSAIAGAAPHPDLRTAWDEGDRVLHARRPYRPPPELVHDEFPDLEAGVADTFRAERVDQAAHISVRRRGPALDRRRLPDIRAPAAQQWRARRSAAPVGEFGSAHDHQPPDASAAGGRRAHTGWTWLGLWHGRGHHARR